MWLLCKSALLCTFYLIKVFKRWRRLLSWKFVRTIYVMCATWGDKVSSRQLYASDGIDLLHQEQCSQAPTEGRAVLWRWIMEEIEWWSWDVSELFKGIDVSWMFPVITTTQTNTIEGSRL